MLTAFIKMVTALDSNVPVLQNGKVAVRGEEWRERQPKDSSLQPNGSVAYVGVLGMIGEIVRKEMRES